MSQGLASGRFAGDELRSVLEALPEVGQALADQLGVTVGALRDMGAAGELNAQVVFPALLRASKGFIEQLKDVKFTVAQTSQVFKNQFIVAVGAIDNATGATDGLNLGIRAAGNNVGIILVQAFEFFSRAVADALRTGAAFLDLLDRIGLQLPTITGTLGTIGNTFRLLVNGLEVGLQLLLLALEAVNFGFVKLAQKVGLVSPEDFQIAAARFDNASAAVVDASERTNDTIADLLDGFKEMASESGPPGAAADRLRAFADAADEAADKLAKLKTLADIEDAFIGITPKNRPGESEIEDALKKTSKDVTGVLTDLAKDVGDAFAESIGDGIARAMAGEGFDAAQVLADISGSLIEAALEDAVKALSKGIAETFTKVAESLGVEAGGAFASALAGAIGVGIGILARELAGGSATARNDLVRSAVESTQATRGVVAGPTSIPVFQVGQQLEAALSQTNGILGEILNAILLDTGGGGGGTSVSAAGSSAASDLALSTPSLA